MMTIVRRANSCQVRILLALKLLMTDLRVERGTLFASRSDVVASHWVMWVLANLALFLLPFSTGIWVIFLLRYLGAIPSTSAFDLTCTLVYFCFPVACYLIFDGRYMISDAILVVDASQLP